MLNNFIYAKQKSLFEEKLNAGEVLDEAIVFIEDTKEIWNHGEYFSCAIATVDANDELDDVETTNYLKFVSQDLTEEQKEQVRYNIGAVSADYVNSMITQALNVEV